MTQWFTTKVSPLNDSDTSSLRMELSGYADPSVIHGLRGEFSYQNSPPNQPTRRPSNPMIVEPGAIVGPENYENPPKQPQCGKKGQEAMHRTTTHELDVRLNTVARMLGRDVGHNNGDLYLQGAYGGWKLHHVVNDAGGCEDMPSLRCTKREMALFLDGMQRALELSREDKVQA